MGVEETTETQTKTNEISVSNKNISLNSINGCNNQRLKSKMEAMQRRIDELKEKVKSEGDLLHSKDALLDSERLGNDKFIETFTEFESNSEPIQDNENNSEKSIYFSASNYSLCSLSTNSTDSAYYNFTKFVGNFVKKQNQKERFSLLQLHSNKQISLNMMRNSLSELDSRCAEELELVERSLQHLNQLAVEFNVDRANCKTKEVKFSNTKLINHGKLETRFIWPYLKTSTTIDWSKNPEFIKPNDKTNSTM